MSTTVQRQPRSSARQQRPKSVATAIEKSEKERVLSAVKEWNARHGAHKALPRKLQNEWDRVFDAGRSAVLTRLIAQCEETDSHLPAETYAEAIEGLARLGQFRRLQAGPDFSKRVNECLAPLAIDLFHLAFMLAEKGDDPNADIVRVLGIDVIIP